MLPRINRSYAYEYDEALMKAPASCFYSANQSVAVEHNCSWALLMMEKFTMMSWKQSQFKLNSPFSAFAIEWAKSILDHPSIYTQKRVKIHCQTSRWFRWWLIRWRMWDAQLRLLTYINTRNHCKQWWYQCDCYTIDPLKNLRKSLSLRK